MPGLVARLKGSRLVGALKKRAPLKYVVAWRSERAYRVYEAEHNAGRIRFIERHLPKQGIGAELGVFKGLFSPILLRHTNARKLHLVDPWYFLTPEWHWGGGNRSTVSAVINILKQHKRDIEQGRVLVHIEDDLCVLESFPDEYFDWVYIDSSHAYEHTKKELALVQSKIKKDGVISGDDWQPDPDHRHHGVYQAVQEFVANSDFELLEADETYRQWAIKRKA